MKRGSTYWEAAEFVNSQERQLTEVVLARRGWDPNAASDVQAAHHIAVALLPIIATWPRMKKEG